MCTVSIFSKDDTLIVTMNRDEQRTREEEKKLKITDGYCYPVDAPSQGTWVGMNKDGIACTLLNRYQDPHNLNALKSRGEIIPTLLKCQNLEEARQKINNFSFKEFNPFDLLIINLNELIHVTWNGQNPTVKKQTLNTPFFISSSSERTDEVLRYRQDVFDSYVPLTSKRSEDILSKLHLQCEEEQEGSSILMRRKNTHTKSIVQIVLEPKQAQICYWPEGSLTEKIKETNITLSQEKTICHYFTRYKEKTERRQYGT